MSDRKVFVVLKDDDIFITTKTSFNTTTYGITGVGVFESQKSVEKDVIIPWGNISHIEKATF